MEPRVSIAEFIVLRIEKSAFHEEGTTPDVVSMALSNQSHMLLRWYQWMSPEKMATLWWLLASLTLYTHEAHS
jgi:hypothetical protein